MLKHTNCEREVGGFSLSPGPPPTFVRGGVMPEARDLVFFYNGVELTDESVENVPAEFPLPYCIFLSDEPRGGPNPRSTQH
jgi:hypothetical protein